ncbi:hypothetical protein [Hydrogenimonas sp.]
MRLVWLVLLPFWLAAQPLVIAANPQTPFKPLTLQQIRALYTAKRFTLQGRRALLLQLPLDHPLRKRFEKRILGRPRPYLAKVWIRAHFHGHHPPKVVQSLEAAAAIVAKVPYALAYMDRKSAMKHHLKILWSEP